MGQAGSVPDEYYKARAPGDRVIQNLLLQLTIKYTYSNGGYSLSQQGKRGALIIKPASILVFVSHKLLVDIKFDDPRWKNAKIRGTYERDEETLTLSLDTREFHNEIAKYLDNEPPSYVEGAMILSIEVTLEQMFVDRIFKNQPSESFDK